MSKRSNEETMNKSKIEEGKKEAVVVWEKKESNVIPFKKQSFPLEHDHALHESTYTEWSIKTEGSPVKIKVISSGFGQTYQNGKLYCAA